MLDKKLFTKEIELFLIYKLQELNLAIENCKESVFNEQKSSAGDKYETGRAMAQIQLEMLEKQQKDLTNQIDFFNRIDFYKKNNVISIGSLVKTNLNTYFICVGIGNVKIDNHNFICISTQSPVAIQLLGKKAKDQISFNGNIQIIEMFE